MDNYIAKTTFIAGQPWGKRTMNLIKFCSVKMWAPL